MKKQMILAALAIALIGDLRLASAGSRDYIDQARQTQMAALLDVFNIQAKRDADEWASFAEHCANGQGQVRADVIATQDPEVSFVCLAEDGKYYSTPSHTKRYMGSRIVLAWRGALVLLMDGEILGRVPRVSGLSIPYQSSVDAFQEGGAAVIAPETIEKALRLWIENFLRNRQLKSQGEGAIERRFKF